MDPEVPVLARISDYVGFWADADPQRVAHVLGEQRVTYEQLAETVTHWGKALLSLGVMPGDRVALLGNPRPETISLFLAAASVGAVFQGLNPKHQHSELAFQLADSQPVLVLTTLEDNDSESALQQLAGTISSIRHVGGHPIGEFLAGAGSVSDAALSEGTRRVSVYDPAALVYTSGSTGRPKGALLPHRGFTWGSVVQAGHWLDQGPGSIICNLPIDHVGAIGNICCSALVSGGTVVFQERFDAAGVLALIEAERVDYWGAVPAMFMLSMNRSEWKHADLSSLRKVIWSGGAAPVALIDALRSRCPNLSMSYGLTETVGDVTFSDPADDVSTLSTTIGRPDPRYEVQVVNDDGTACDIEEEGEIVVRGDFVMRGYLNQPEATAATIDSNGWLHTGDMARRRADGCFILVGRKTEMFKSGGYNVYPREVELALEEHPSVRLAAVVGVRDETYGYVGHAYVLADPSEITAEELVVFAKERLANYKVPKGFTVAPDLPMLPIGKIDKKALEAKANA